MAEVKYGHANGALINFDNKKFARGLKPSPRHVLAAATPHKVVKAVPSQFAMVPKQLSMWLNDQVGDCVTAEEAFAKAAYSVMLGLPELFIPDSEVQSWATQYGFLNGADLVSVMDQMAKKGFQVGGMLYGDGPPNSVDYSNEVALQSAISTGPVKIGIDANALPGGAGNGNGWWATGGSPGQFNSEDHCVGLAGYGTAQYLYQQLGLAVPSGLNPSTTGYLLFTWSSLGFVDHAWLMSTCGEAWVRTPTTPGEAPSPVPPVPPSPPSPPVPPDNLTITQAQYTSVVAVVSACQQPKSPKKNHNILSSAQQMSDIWGPLVQESSVEQILKDVFLHLDVVTASQKYQVTTGTIPVIEIVTTILPVLLADLAAGKKPLLIVGDLVAAVLKVLG